PVAHYFCRLLRLLVITAEHHLASHEYFAVRFNPDPATRHRWANRSELVIFGAIESDADVFRQTIRLQDRNAAGIEELCYLKRKRRAARCCQAHAPAEVIINFA